MKQSESHTENAGCSGEGFNAWILLEPVAGRELKKRLESIRIAQLAYHSARVKPGTLFFACRAERLTAMIMRPRRFAGERQFWLFPARSAWRETGSQ